MHQFCPSWASTVFGINKRQVLPPTPRAHHLFAVCKWVRHPQSGLSVHWPFHSPRTQLCFSYPPLLVFAPHLLTFLCPQFPNLYLQSWQDLQLICISTTPDIHLPDKQLELNFAKAEFISSLLNLFLLCLPSAENDPTLSSVASVCSLYSFTYFPHPSH